MDSDNLESVTDTPSPAMAGPGDRLRAAREALRLELSHVAADTRIPLRHLEAIEANNFESLPSRAYAIGFSRTFAKAVGLDEGAIIDAVRAELADGSMQRNVRSAAMEPGDPARLPSRGLAWASTAAVVVLGIGVVAFGTQYFGAGTVPGSLLTPEPAETAAPVAAAPSTASPAPAASGAVVLTALEDGVWLRLYEEGGARLVERTLKQGEAVTVPANAADPRLNTGRPDALGLTIGGQSVARIAEQPRTISGVPVSAAALLARESVSVSPSATPSVAPAATTPTAAPLRAPARRAEPSPSPVAEQPAAAPSPAPAPPPATEPAPAAER